MDAVEDAYGLLSRPNDLQRGGLAAHVTAQLRDAIIACRLPPGTMLDKSRICEKLGVSRAPVAEAFARLEAEGFVDILPQRGTVVTFLCMNEINEMVFIRKALEGQAARGLAGIASPEVLSALDDNVEAQREALDSDDLEHFHVLDGVFHELLVEELSYRRIRAMVESARNTLSRVRQMTNTRHRVQGGINEHAAVVEAIRSGDGMGAALAMEAHLDGITIAVSRLAEEQPHLFSNRRTIHNFGTIRRAPSP